MFKKLDGFTLKLIALLSMTIDHIGVFFYLDSGWRIVGRLAFPIFAFLLTEGYRHTHNRKKHFLTIALSGVIMQIPLFFMQEPMFNIFLTLALGMLALYGIEFKNYFLVGLILLSAWIFPFDYGLYGILLIIGSYLLKNRWLLFSIYSLAIAFLSQYTDHLSVIQLYAIAALPFIYMYNGQRGRSWKWFFYIYYPLHIIIINILATLVMYLKQ